MLVWLRRDERICLLLERLVALDFQADRGMRVFAEQINQIFFQPFRQLPSTPRSSQQFVLKMTKWYGLLLDIIMLTGMWSVRSGDFFSFLCQTKFIKQCGIVENLNSILIIKQIAATILTAYKEEII